MKLLVLNYEYPPLGGGAGVIAQHISEGLAGLGHSVTVLSAAFDDLPLECTENNVRVFRVKSRRKFVYRSNPFEMWSWMQKATKFLKHHLKTNTYDLCFANFSIPGGMVAYRMKLMYGLPYTIISHGHDIPWFFPKQMFWYHLVLYHQIRNIVLQSEKNFVQSTEMKNNIDLFTGDAFKYKNTVIHNGWDSSVFAPDYSKRSDSFIILFAGRLVQQKDPFTFLKAIKTVAGEVPCTVHILGDGPLRNKMQAWVDKNGLSQRFCFLGWVNKHEMLLQYQSAWLTVLPSLSEGMSIATLEALACGQYVIATRVSNNESLINEGVNGNLIGHRDYHKLANYITEFYQQKFLKRLTISEENLKHYHSLYEWSDIVNQYEKEFIDAIEKQSNR